MARLSHDTLAGSTAAQPHGAPFCSDTQSPMTDSLSLSHTHYLRRNAYIHHSVVSLSPVVNSHLLPSLGKVLHICPIYASSAMCVA